ncbi:hypothetical protein BS47DRAFT_1368393 [Hydnum rufescens UP504]|uniref:malate dehydrogenase n=1 Tax=Hydnum rufescens UP504 TaxID=1448309 RepID=A0A9P6AGT9_9AGAM|nr:hypothetical protein BS47DRAFT_1368393 [Hydnum rufescens UP504]
MTMALPFTGHCLNQNQEMNTPNNNPWNENTPNDDWLSMTHSLSLYDISGAPGIAADMSHVATAGEVNGYISGEACNALQGTKIIIIAGWRPIEAKHYPMNSTVSIVTEVLKKASKFNPAKVWYHHSWCRSPSCLLWWRQGSDHTILRQVSSL